MKKDTNLIVRVNSDVKDKVQKVAEENGVSVSSIINFYLTDIARKGRILPYTAARIKGMERQKDNVAQSELLVAFLKHALQTCPTGSKVKKAYLFGSYSRNEQTEDSDIDLRIEFDDDSSLLDMSGLKIELEDILHKKVDVVCPNPGDPFLDIIRKDEILVYAR